jgi:hypothetical protein
VKEVDNEHWVEVESVFEQSRRERILVTTPVNWQHVFDIMTRTWFGN